MATLKLDLKDWQVPGFVQTQLPGKGETSSVKIEDVEADSLSELCDNFRRSIFKRAGKQDPRALRMGDY